MSDIQLKAIREFIYFVEQTGELSGKDADFLKAMYYDFKIEYKDRVVL